MRFMGVHIANCQGFGFNNLRIVKGVIAFFLQALA